MTVPILGNSRAWSNEFCGLHCGYWSAEKIKATLLLE